MCIGDCWFIAAVACLAVAPEQLFHRVVPLSQHFQHDYAGITAVFLTLVSSTKS